MSKLTKKPKAPVLSRLTQTLVAGTVAIAGCGDDVDSDAGTIDAGISITDSGPGPDIGFDAPAPGFDAALDAEAPDPGLPPFDGGPDAEAPDPGLPPFDGGPDAEAPAPGLPAPDAGS